MPSLLRLLQDFDATAKRIEAATLDERWTLLERLYDLVRAGGVLVEMGSVDPGERSRLRVAYGRVSAIDELIRDQAISAARREVRAELDAVDQCEQALERLLATTDDEVREAASAELRRAVEHSKHVREMLAKSVRLRGADSRGGSALTKSEGQIASELGGRWLRFGQRMERAVKGLVPMVKLDSVYHCEGCSKLLPVPTPPSVSTPIKAICGDCGIAMTAAPIGPEVVEYRVAIAEAETALQKLRAAIDKRSRLTTLVFFVEAMRHADRAHVSVSDSLSPVEAAVMRGLVEPLVDFGMELERVRGDIAEAFSSWHESNS